MLTLNAQFLTLARMSWCFLFPVVACCRVAFSLLYLIISSLVPSYFPFVHELLIFNSIDRALVLECPLLVEVQLRFLRLSSTFPKQHKAYFIFFVYYCSLNIFLDILYDFVFGIQVKEIVDKTG